MVPLAAANRIGTESQDGVTMTFYGSSFIAGPRADFKAKADKAEEAILTASFDLKQIEQDRAEWGLIRDRRPENYGRLIVITSYSIHYTKLYESKRSGALI